MVAARRLSVAERSCGAGRGGRCMGQAANTGYHVLVVLASRRRLKDGDYAQGTAAQQQLVQEGHA